MSHTKCYIERDFICLATKRIESEREREKRERERGREREGEIATSHFLMKKSSELETRVVDLVVLVAESDKH